MLYLDYHVCDMLLRFIIALLTLKMKCLTFIICLRGNKRNFVTFYGGKFFETKFGDVIIFQNNKVDIYHWDGWQHAFYKVIGTCNSFT